MQAQSIFDGGFMTYPTIFKKSKLFFNEALITNKVFTLGPGRKMKGSVTNLKNNVGIKVGGVATFNTPFISGKDEVLYNGYLFSLVIKNNIVLIAIRDGKSLLQLESWDLNEIAKSFNCKNPKCDVIPSSYVADLITAGRLQVKFKVGTDKNHGTDWKLI